MFKHSKKRILIIPFVLLESWFVPLLVEMFQMLGNVSKISSEVTFKKLHMSMHHCHYSGFTSR
jgi:predicted DNA repair protein MutK